MAARKVKPRYYVDPVPIRWVIRDRGRGDKIVEEHLKRESARACCAKLNREQGHIWGPVPREPENDRELTYEELEGGWT